MRGKKVLFYLAVIGIFMTLSLDTVAQPNFNYLTEIEAYTPMAIAADENGGLYYTYFTFDGPELSRVYYVADPLSEPALESHRAIVDEDPSPAGRGWHGLAVDDTGAVYAALETGSGDTCEVRKLTPAPEFALDENFFGGIIMDGQRHNGIAWMGRDTQGIGTIAVSTFTTCEIWNADDGNLIVTASGGESYQRDCAYNPTNGDIYISTNKDRSGEGLSQRSVSVWTGGSLENIEGYSAEITNGLVEEGAANSTWGINGQQIGFDASNGLIMIAFRDSGQDELNNTLGFYDPADPSAAVLRLDASESPNGPFQGPADAVTVQTENETLLFVSDTPADRIVIFSTGATAVQEFMLY